MNYLKKFFMTIIVLGGKLSSERLFTSCKVCFFKQRPPCVYKNSYPFNLQLCQNEHTRVDSHHPWQTSICHLLVH